MGDTFELEAMSELFHSWYTCTLDRIPSGLLLPPLPPPWSKAARSLKGEVKITISTALKSTPRRILVVAKNTVTSSILSIITFSYQGMTSAANAGNSAKCTRKRRKKRNNAFFRYNREKKVSTSCGCLVFLEFTPRSTSITLLRVEVSHLVMRICHAE